MVRKVVASAVALTFVVARALPALAEDATTFRLSWVRGEGAGSCPDVRALEARVAERLGRNPFSDAAAQSIEGSVALDKSELKAELRVRDSGGIARGAREIRAQGTDCVELADAVVLAVALAIDPNAALGGPANTAAPRPPAPPPPPLAPNEPPALAACPPARCPAPPSCPEARCPEPRFPNMALTARALLGAGMLPELAPGAAVAGELGGPRVRGTLGMLYFPEVSTSDELYSFGLTAASLGAVVAWPVGGGFEFSALGELELGTIHAVVFDTEPVDPGDRPWFAGALGPRVAFAGLAPLRLELGANLVVPFVRPEFEVRGIAGPVFQSSAVGGVFYFGLGVGAP